jgi:ferric-dicitrate binding protein FerR (iron transport regulator)
MLSKNDRQEILKPGQGGIIANGTNDIMVESTDVEQDLAWKNGNFYFQKTELTTIMKQLARWYDLEIRYSGAIPKKRFVGKISRYTNLSDVLDVLRLSDIKFAMTGKTLTVEE